MLAQTRSTWRAYPPVAAREDCSICQGTGWELVGSSRPLRARRCGCVALARTIKLKEQIRIPRQYESCTLESYRPRSLSQTHALAEAWKFAERFPGVERGMIFVGGPCVGKTHLAVGIMLELARRFQEDILFVDFRSLPGLSWSFGGNGRNGSVDPARLKTVSLLLLDDFGAGSATPNQYQAAFQIVQARLRARKPTICTSVRLEGLGGGAQAGLETQGKSNGTPCSILLQANALLLGGFKIVLMSGEDYRRRNRSASALF
jgi:DNA replication protein DnaC